MTYAPAVEEPVSFRAVYERFPATVKGAFVLRGADGLPHQVRIEAARVAECAGRGSLDIPIDHTVIEAAPTLDTFVPFEIPTMELASGWYQLECDVIVDAVASLIRPGERFLMPWPRSAVRRGTVPLDTSSGSVGLEAVDFGGDSVRISFTAERAPGLRLAVDGSPHPVLEIEFDEGSGRGRVVGYPVLRANEQLAIEVRGEAVVDVVLP